MSSVISQKGKEKAADMHETEDESTTLLSDTLSSDADSDTDSHSDSDSESDSSGSDSDEDITEEFLEQLLERARHNARLKAQDRTGRNGSEGWKEEEELRLEGGSLPALNPGTLPDPYIKFDGPRKFAPSAVRDLNIERSQKATASITTPAAPAPPPEVTSTGKPLTKKERKALKHKTAGPGWFDLPEPDAADLPRLYREVEALRLRNHLDPKRFYRRDEGEGKGIKGLPKHFAIGTIVATPSPFGAHSAENLSRSNRKRTLVDELVDDAETRSYAKKKFRELQRGRGAKGRNTLHAKNSMRKRKW
ncbi:Fcf2-domain-containing protein [Wolfiporia cocos MD-104 SS10]|uniref:Fcf2-domain-containing protein n=1 Tax=Wolfiporia cocos (strain MD-104) TaxID=742152 RepID=A0A2H3JQI8_WOLCO|nr:Fcf2-domain-containing protein [Wolfiporia cocos MD-104 SS10]